MHTKDGIRRLQIENTLAVLGDGGRSANKMMLSEWLNYSVAIDGVTIADARDGRAHNCSEAELFNHIELVINSIEQPHGEGRLTPSHIFSREMDFSERFDSGDIVSRDELLKFANDVSQYYELLPGIEAPRFIDNIDPKDPCINVKAADIQRQINEMIDNHPRNRVVQWDRGTELMFAFASITVTVIVVVTMALWFKFQS